jgi:hypothetical protein
MAYAATDVRQRPRAAMSQSTTMVSDRSEDQNAVSGQGSLNQLVVSALGVAVIDHKSELA